MQIQSSRENWDEGFVNFSVEVQRLDGCQLSCQAGLLCQVLKDPTGEGFVQMFEKADGTEANDRSFVCIS